MFKWLKSLFSSSGDIDITESVEELDNQLKEMKKEEVQVYDMQDFAKEFQKILMEELAKQQPDFIKTDDYNKIQYEFETNDIEVEHWSDKDFIEFLLDYLQQGYKFDGLQDLYKKTQSGKDLSDKESQQLRNWYKLVSTEVVYDV